MCVQMTNISRLTFDENGNWVWVAEVMPLEKALEGTGIDKLSKKVGLTIGMTMDILMWLMNQDKGDDIEELLERAYDMTREYNMTNQELADTIETVRKLRFVNL